MLKKNIVLCIVFSFLIIFGIFSTSYISFLVYTENISASSDIAANGYNNSAKNVDENKSDNNDNKTENDRDNTTQSCGSSPCVFTTKYDDNDMRPISCAPGRNADECKIDEYIENDDLSEDFISGFDVSNNTVMLC